MYRKPRFLKVLHAIREEMSREVDYDVDLFVQMIRAVEQPVQISGRVGRTPQSKRARPVPGGTVVGEETPRAKGRKRVAR